MNLAQKCKSQCRTKQSDGLRVIFTGEEEPLMYLLPDNDAYDRAMQTQDTTEVDFMLNEELSRSMALQG